MQDQKEVIDEINEEIKKAKADPEEFQIEITEDPKEEAKDVAEEKQQAEEQQAEKDEYGEKVQKRIKKLVDQRRDAEEQLRTMQEQNAQLNARLSRLEQGSEKSAQNEFKTRYDQTKRALEKATEEGDTKAAIAFTEQLADMRAALRVAEMQRQQAQQTVQNPAPPKAIDWWQKNNWFNSPGFERETALARSFDIQIEMEGFDKNSDDYYNELNNRLQKVFPELVSGSSPTKTKVKSRQPIAPSTGGSSYKGNRVRMSKDQLEMARQLGISDERSLKKYESEIRKQQRG